MSFWFKKEKSKQKLEENIAKNSINYKTQFHKFVTVFKNSNHFSLFSRPSLQSLLITRLSFERETKATSNSNDFHFSTIEGAWTGVPRDPLPGHLHTRGNRHENRPHRSKSAGESINFQKSSLSRECGVKNYCPLWRSMINFFRCFRIFPGFILLAGWWFRERAKFSSMQNWIF